MERRRLLYVIGGLGVGGAERQLLELCSGLDRASFAPLVVSLDAGYEYARAFREREIPVVELVRRGSADVARLLELRRLVARERPALVHAFLVGPSLYARLACLGVRPRPRVLVSERSLASSRPFAVRAADRALSGLADCYVTNAAAVRDDLLRSLAPRRPRVEVIPNGFDPAFARRARPRAEVRAELGLQDGEKVVLFVGRLVDDKDLPTLLTAFAHVGGRPGVRLLVAGDGPERPALESASREGTLPVTLLGMRGDVPDLMRAADLLVLSSKVEGFPNVVGEALLAGLPVAATAAGGVPEVVRSGVDGLVVPIGDGAALGRALERLLDDPAAARRMAESGARRMREDFSIEVMVRRTEALYRAILAPPRRS
jgi:glycosyltransferase involved in cell wall biosynthesis